MTDTAIIIGLCSAGAAVVGSAMTILTSRITAAPAQENALTERFKALIDRQEVERANAAAQHEAMIREYAAEKAKLERVAADLEVMVIRFIEWADAVTLKAEREHFDLPPRPKFHHLREFHMLNGEGSQ